MKITIKITKDILKKSMMCGSYPTDKNIGQNCAIALAIRDIFPDAHIQKYKILTNYYCKENILSKRGLATYVEEINILLPDIASDFIILFDSLRLIPENRLLLPELSFEIEISDELIETIGINEAIEIINKSETLELV